MATTERLRPDDPAERNPWPCWHEDGWECAGEWSMQDATKVTRGKAHAKAAREIGLWADVAVWKRYIRILTRQESFEYSAMERVIDRWIDNHEPPLRLNDDLKYVLPDGTICEPPKSLEVVPDDWRPDEDDPVWEFVHRSHPDAMPYWVVGERGSKPPPNPPAVGGEGNTNGD